MTRGVHIVFEGGDGAGKSAQARHLASTLRNRHEVVLTAEPGGTWFGRKIRELVLGTDADIDPKAEALLFAADRAHHIATLVRPALERGAVVVQDRYVDSSIAYQGLGRGLDIDEVLKLSAWATDGLTPDLTIVLDGDPAVLLARTKARGETDRMEAEALEFHERVRQHYLDAARAHRDRYVVFDATRPFDAIAGEIAAAVAVGLKAAGSPASS